MSKYEGKTREQIMREMADADRARYDAKHGIGAYDRAEQIRLAERERWHGINEQCRKANAERQHLQAVAIAQAYAAQGNAPDACVLAALRG